MQSLADQIAMFTIRDRDIYRNNPDGTMSVEYPPVKYTPVKKVKPWDLIRKTGYRFVPWYSGLKVVV